MMSKKSRTSLFLMELILSLLLFALTSAVCARLFVQTHQREKQAKELQFAMTESQTVTALLREHAAFDVNGLLTKLAGSYTGSERSSENALFVFYDEAFHSCSASAEAAYRMTLTLTKEDGMLQTQLRFDALPDSTDSAASARLPLFSDDTMIRSFTFTLYQNRPFARAEQEAK